MRWVAIALTALFVFATAPADLATAQTAPAGQAPALSGGPSPRTSATEAEIWRGVRKGMEGRVSIPDAKAGILIQSEGENWRNIRNGPLSTYGVWLLLGIVVLLAAFFAVRGRIRIDAGPANRTVQRFGTIERFGHWLTATAFIVLALTGLNMLYGRYVLLPVLGPSIFSTLTLWGKYAHNYVAFAFMLGLVLLAVLWIRHNIPNGQDLAWLAKGGGLFKKGVHPAARKFNAGQKLVFWAVVLGGIALSVTGFYLLMPFEFGMTIHDMQYFVVVHSVVALVLTAVIIAHIYIGSIGMEGAFDAMGTGQVDENWAREHHNLWLAEIQGKPRAQAGHDD